MKAWMRESLRRVLSRRDEKLQRVLQNSPQVIKGSIWSSSAAEPPQTAYPCLASAVRYSERAGLRQLRPARLDLADNFSQATEWSKGVPTILL